MLTTDQLNQLVVGLQTACLQNGNVVSELRAFLGALIDTPAYRDWLEYGQYVPASDADMRFRIPADLLSALSNASRHIVERYLITRDRRLTIKVERFFGTLHASDGFWVDPRVRVYPTNDESELLCGYIKRQGYEKAADILIDPACGSGRHGMAIDVPAVLSLDVSVRALSFCVLNSILAGSYRQMAALNDMRRGFPEFLVSWLNGKVLIAVNMPFGLYPRVERTPLSQDGGSHGAELTLAALEAVVALWRKSVRISALRAVFLFHSLGRSQNGPWQLEQALEKWPETAGASCTLLAGEPVWRINGRKRQSNPMPIERMEERAACRLTWPHADEVKIRAAYRELQENLKAEGWTHLGFGLLDIGLAR